MMISGPYPVLVHAMSEDRPFTAEEIEYITARIDRELGPDSHRRSDERFDGVRSMSIKLAAASIGIDRRNPAFRRLRARLRGTLHLDADRSRCGIRTGPQAFKDGDRIIV